MGCVIIVGSKKPVGIVTDRDKKAHVQTLSVTELRRPI
jgi:hypothetical protein